LGYVWLDIVSEFGGLHLTHESDRLPALSGLAYEFSNRSLGLYITDIWEHDLTRGLLFETVTPGESLASNPTQPSAPSWSWAAGYLAGTKRISYELMLRDDVIQDSRFCLMGIFWTPHASSPFTWVEHGQLQVKGACTMARILVKYSASGEHLSRKFVLEVGGVSSIIPMRSFINDFYIQHLDDTPLYCLLVGRQLDSEGNDGRYKISEYILVLHKECAELNTYKRVGLLLIRDESCSIRNEPVLTVLLS
jgi:hypothetical protein